MYVIFDDLTVCRYRQAVFLAQKPHLIQLLPQRNQPQYFDEYCNFVGRTHIYFCLRFLTVCYLSFFYPIFMTVSVC